MMYMIGGDAFLNCMLVFPEPVRDSHFSSDASFRPPLNNQPRQNNNADDIKTCENQKHSKTTTARQSARACPTTPPYPHPSTSSLHSPRHTPPCPPLLPEEHPPPPYDRASQPEAAASPLPPAAHGSPPQTPPPTPHPLFTPPNIAQRVFQPN